MKLLIKIACSIFAVLIGMVFVAVIVLKTVSNEQFKEWGTAAAYNFTGRQLVIDGEFSVHIGKQISLLAENIRFANAQNGSRPDMATVDRLYLQLEVLPLFQGVLDFVIEVDGPDILLETNDEGKMNWAFKDSALGEEVAPDQKSETSAGSFVFPFKPFIRNFEIRDLAFAFRDTLSDKDISAEINTLKIFVDGPNIPLSFAALYNGVPIELTGTLGRIEDLHLNQKTFISLQGKLNEAELAIHGSLGPLVPQPTAQIDLRIQAETIATFGPLAGVTLPDLRGLDLSMTAVAGDGQLAVDDVKIVLNDSRLNFNISGAIEDLAKVRGIDLKTEIHSEQLGAILEQLDVDFPVALPASLSINAAVTGSLEQLSMSGLNAVVEDEGVGVNLAGTIENLITPAGVDLKLTATADSIARISKFAGIEIPDLGPLELQGTISSENKQIRIDTLAINIAGEILNAQVKAEVADLLYFSGINATADITIDSLSSLSTLADFELPETEPWTLNISTEAGSGVEGAVTVFAQLGSKGFQAEIDAIVPDIKDMKTMQATLSMDIETLAFVGQVLSKELPKEGPIKITASVGSLPEEYRVDNFHLSMGEAAASGDLQYTIPGGGSDRPKIAGQMEFKDFDITKLAASNIEEPGLPAGESTAMDEPGGPNKGKTPVKGKKIFSSEPFSVGILQDYDVDLKVNVSNCTISDDVTGDGSLHVTLERGLLKLGLFDVRGNPAGSGEGLIVLDAGGPETKLDILLKFNDFVSPRIGGTLNLDVDLDGTGASIASVMGSLNGRFIAAVNDVQLKQSMMTRFGSGLFTQINPLSNDTTMLECAIARFDAQDGIVDFTKKIAAQTTEVTWVGSGVVNLKTEVLDLVLHPKPRKVLHSLTDVGLAKLIHIGGTLADPDIGIDPKDVAVKYATYSAHIATGGLSFLAEKIFHNRQANMDQCLRILAE